MKFLKATVLSLLSLLLFLSVSLFGIAFTVNSTLLNPDFVVDEVSRIDVPSLVKEVAEGYIAQLPREIAFLKDTAYKFISDKEPWLKEQLRRAIYASYDYFLGKSNSLKITIPLEPLKKDLKENLKRAFLQSPPPVAGLPPAQMEQYFDQFYEQFATQIPATITLDESMLPVDVKTQLVKIREYISYFQLAYKLLIGFMVLLILGIILIKHQVKSVSRGLGTTFLTYGAFEYAGIFVARYFLPNLPPFGIPLSLQPWLTQLTIDLTKPLEMFSLGCLIVGVVLLVVSFVYRPRVVQEI